MKAYQLKVELVDSQPLIWRQVVIPADVTFKRLNDTIREAMGWDILSHHLYEFSFPQEMLRITNDEEAYDRYKYYSAKYKNKQPTKRADPHGMIARLLQTNIRQPQTIKIDSFLEKYGTFQFLYDFGDCWLHTITLEKVIDDYQFGYPTVLAGEGACPPEDVGGIDNYYEFLKAWSDPSHPEHEEMREWAGRRYQGFDLERINSNLRHFLRLKKSEIYP